MDRFSEAVVALTVILVGGLVGSAVGPILANALFSPLPRVTEWLLPPVSLSEAELLDVDPERLFGPSSEPSPRPGTDVVEEEEPCPATLRLVGVAHDRRDSSRSVAAIRNESSTRAVRPDERFGDWTLVSTRRSGAVLRRDDDGRTCALGLFQRAPVATPPVTAPSEDGGITTLGEDHYAVDRSLLQTLMGGTHHRVIPHERDGRVVGYRLFGVRRSGPAGQAGLQNGDTLIAVNGSPVHPIDRLLEAYGALSEGATVQITVERRGQPHELRYEVR